jgi:hypothetical protein
MSVPIKFLRGLSYHLSTGKQKKFCLNRDSECHGGARTRSVRWQRRWLSVFNSGFQEAQFKESEPCVNSVRKISRIVGQSLCS